MRVHELSEHRFSKKHRSPPDEQKPEHCLAFKSGDTLYRSRSHGCVAFSDLVIHLTGQQCDLVRSAL